MIHNIPVVWTLDRGTPGTEGSYPYYTGVPQIDPSILGNTITAKWGNLGVSTVTGGGSSTIFWWTMTLTMEFKQGEKVKMLTNEIEHPDPAYYPHPPFRPGDESSISWNISEALVTGVPITIKTKQNSSYSRTDFNQTIPLDVTSIVAEKPSNFNKLGTTIYQDLTVSWRLDSSNLCDYTVTQAGKQLMAANGVSSREITIKSGLLTSTENVVINVRSHFTFLGQKYYSEWVTYTISGLKAFTATDIINFRYVGATKHIEEPMTFAWDNAEQIQGVVNKAIFELWQDGILKFKQEGMNTNTCSIPANTLSSTNSIQTKVRNVSTYLTYTATSSDKTLNVSGLTSVAPVIKDFTLETLNADYDINIAPSVTGATQYAYEYNNKRYSGLVITKGTLIKGTCSVTLIAIATTSQGNKVESKLLKTFNIVHDEPTILSLEPNEININVTQETLISFITTEFIDTAILYLPTGLQVNFTKEQGILKDNQRTFTYACKPNTFKNGSNSISVKTTYRVNRFNEALSSFTGYGIPTKPTIVMNDIQQTAHPTITWIYETATDSDVQTGYEINIRRKSDNVLVNTHSENTSSTEYTCVNALSDDTEYIVELKIKNKYQIFSEYVQQGFITQFNELPIPIIQLFQSENALYVKWITTPQPETFKECSVLRKHEDEVEWVQIGHKYNSSDALVDYSVKPSTSVSYKIRLFDNNGSYVDSDVATSLLDIDTFNIYDVENPSNNINLDFVKPVYKFNSNKVVRKFAGIKKPIVFRDKLNYINTSLVIIADKDTTKELEKMDDTGTVFCFRGWDGIRQYVALTINSITPLNVIFNNISCDVTEVNFSEENMYSGNNIVRLVYFNGIYKFDGSVDLSGYSRG